MELAELDERDFKDLKDHLNKPNIPIKKSKNGVTKQFGIVRKRAEAPDLSADSWKDARLYYLLMRFAREHINIPFTSVQISDSKTYVKHSEGNCYIVSFGSYMDGELVIDTKEYNIRHRPMIFDISKMEDKYFSKEYSGNRWTLIYYSLKAHKKFPITKSLLEYESITRDGEYVIAWYKEGESVQYLSKKSGLQHITKSKKKKGSNLII